MAVMTKSTPSVLKDRTDYKAKRVLCGRTGPSLLYIFYFGVRFFV